MYVDVYVLEKQDFRATIPGLLEGRDAREQFDRFGLGKRGERSPGLAIAASEDYPRLMVLGKPGSGKSTFLRYLAVSCARGEFLGNYIPILLELRDTDDAGFSLFQCIHEELELEQESQTEQILKQGQMLILLDGLDEVPSSLRQKVQDDLRKFAKRYSRNRFVLTCRTQTTEYIPEQFQPVEVADFNSEQVEHFALNWFTAMAQTPEQGIEAVNRFMERLQKSPQTAELAVTPVLLSLTCWIFDDLKYLPEKRSDLYRDGLDLLLQQWDEGRGISRDSGSDRYQQLTTEERKQLLSYLAFRKFEQAENFVLFEEFELCSYIAEYLQISVEESRMVLRAIAQQHGLLIERADRIWSFSHLTFQEYLAAIFFDGQVDWTALINNVFQRHWGEVFLLLSEITEDIDTLIFLMKQKIDLHIAPVGEIQYFLSWLEEKAKHINVSYKQAAIRAFGYTFVLSHSIEINFEYAYRLSTDLIFERDFSFESALIPNEEQKQTPKAFLVPLDLAVAIDSRINQDLANVDNFSLGLAFASDSSELEKVRQDLPSRNSSEVELREWWITRGRNWIEELKHTLEEYRSFKYKWQFGDKQKQYLEQYYYGNYLLLKCLNNSCQVSKKVKENVEETLLLPITEIDKRKEQSLD
ncbi:MAG: NACHT domain-containing protein [Leptolyngbyaceae cyanobacterium bins.302]|nr:NACHT domain-containing protein [Leptolyngbyaceae cyanobacterium bins.302]